MTFLVIVASGVALVALIHLVVGWLVANGLHREMLAVRPAPKTWQCG